LHIVVSCAKTQHNTTRDETEREKNTLQLLSSVNHGVIY